MNRELGAFWLDELADYLLLTKDRRLICEANGNRTILRVCAASKDFCEFLAGVCAAGGRAKSWRTFLAKRDGPGA
jgi:hypothetical protein